MPNELDEGPGTISTKAESSGRLRQKEARQRAFAKTERLKRRKSKMLPRWNRQGQDNRNIESCPGKISERENKRDVNAKAECGWKLGERLIRNDTKPEEEKASFRRKQEEVVEVGGRKKKCRNRKEG